MKNLIAYFSWSGNTEKLVNEINAKFGFDEIKIERAVPYSYDYDTCAYVEAKGEWENRIRPAIKDPNIDIQGYDRVFLFFPIWWYTFPMPVASFIETLKGFKGEIIIFENSYTNDVKYVDNSMNDFLKLDANLNVKQGLFNKNSETHIRFIENIIQ